MGAVVNHINSRQPSLGCVLQVETWSMRCRCCSAKPSDAAARKLLHKVGGTLEEAMQATELDWRGKGLDDDDANVVAYVVMANGALTTLILGSLFGGNNIGGEGAIAIADIVLTSRGPAGARDRCRFLLLSGRSCG